jgi:hypothetical protein
MRSAACCCARTRSTLAAAPTPLAGRESARGPCSG